MYDYVSPSVLVEFKFFYAESSHIIYNSSPKRLIVQKIVHAAEYKSHSSYNFSKVFLCTLY